MYNVLVTGGCGFIGSHLVDQLTKMKHSVRVFDNLEFQVHEGKLPEYLNADAEYIFGDVRNEDALKKVVEDIDIIFHLAACVGVGQSMYEIKRYVDVNSMGTAKLLETLISEEANVKKLIVASSMSIYGEGAYECEDCGVVYPRLRTKEQFKSKKWEVTCPECKKIVKPIPTSESKPLHPTSVYAITKRDQEEMCLTVGKAYGIPTVALRFFNVYGPRQSLSNPYTGVAAIFLSRIKNNNPPLIFEDGLQSRDFVNIRDIVQASILAMESNNANYEVFNVGTGEPTTILKIANVLIKLFRSDLKPKILYKYRSGDIRHCYADISKIKKIGFKPSVQLEKGMSELIEWGNKAKAKDKTEKAQRELKEKGLIEA